MPPTPSAPEAAGLTMARRDLLRVAGATGLWTGLAGLVPAAQKRRRR